MAPVNVIFKDLSGVMEEDAALSFTDARAALKGPLFFFLLIFVCILLMASETSEWGQESKTTRAGGEREKRDERAKCFLVTQ